MDEWKRYFEKSFGNPFPEDKLPDVDLGPIFDNQEKVYLVGTRSAIVTPYLDQADAMNFINYALNGYFMVGFWGHGVNSYAFYYVLADSWRRVFLRLPYGGAYDDNASLARRIGEFIPKYFDFEEQLRGKVKSLQIVDSMGDGFIKIVLPDGRITGHEGSMFFNPDIIQNLGI